MEKELVDVVNDLDEVVGKEMRDVCHKNGLRHRISAALLFRSDGKVWLQTRGSKTVSGIYLDYSAAGHVPSGAGYDDTIRREMLEELDTETKLVPLQKTLLEDKDIQGFRIRHAIRLYIGSSDGPFRLQKSELKALKAYDLEYVRGLVDSDSEVMTEGLRVGLREYFKHGVQRPRAAR